MADPELLKSFVIEARDLLEEAEPCLVELQQELDATGKAGSEIINAVFRAFHSIKANSGFLGLTTINAISHEAETLLNAFRGGKVRLNAFSRPYASRRVLSPKGTFW